MGHSFKLELKLITAPAPGDRLWQWRSWSFGLWVQFSLRELSLKVEIGVVWAIYHGHWPVGRAGRDGRPSQAGQPVRGKPTICPSLVTYGPPWASIIVTIIFTFCDLWPLRHHHQFNLSTPDATTLKKKKDLRSIALVLNIMAEFFLELWA